jgi:hypothetical protein
MHDRGVDGPIAREEADVTIITSLDINIQPRDPARSVVVYVV